MDGMLPGHGSRVVYCAAPGPNSDPNRAFVAYWDDEEGDGMAHWFGLGLPDLTDPATLGCIRHLVVETAGDDLRVYAEQSKGATLAEALTLALEAAQVSEGAVPA
jgi:hypothetical protein